MRLALLSVVLLLTLAACTKIDYVGEEYPPTQQVDMFFSEAEIQVDYKVMGHLIATADDYVSSGKMQKKIMEEARKKGADAVVILGLDRYQSGESQHYSETSETKEKKSGTKTVTSATTTTSVDEKKKIQAIFIKYR
jgi:hypothetical protein